MPSLFAGACENENPHKIYERMESNYPGAPVSRSKVLWELRNATCISPHSSRLETQLEKAVSNLAESGHMPGWFNQCPTASGIADQSIDKDRRVDLVHWSESDRHARLIELKWRSDNPRSALQQILRYGVAYIFCRVHRKELRLHGKFFRPLMDAKVAKLEVVAPRMFYHGHDERSRFARVSKSIEVFARSKTEGALSMSLDAFAFPEEFTRIPFSNGQEVKAKCSTRELSKEGRIVRDAFEGLVPAWPL